ncbi:MAG: PEP-CTERM sorting domain-containing protein [Pseudomonadota bacterium]
MSLQPIRPLLATTLLGFLIVPAQAATYQFHQAGFSGGGVIMGSFDAVDLDGNGQISSFYGEVSSFSLSFSGDALVADFTHGLPDLYGLVYDLGSGFIGDGSSGAVEGMASNWLGSVGFDYASGMGPAQMFGGRVIDIASGATTSTPDLIAVVPEPATWVSLLAGLGVLSLLTRRKSA